MDRQIGTVGNEQDARCIRRKPADSLDGNREDAEFGKANQFTHDANLQKPADRGGELVGVKGFDVVKDDADPRAGSLQDAKNPKDSLRKAAFRPSERCVLDEDPMAAPLAGHEMERVEGISPAVVLPRHPANVELDVVGAERGAEETAILLNGIGWFVLASEEGDRGRGHGRSANRRHRSRKLTTLLASAFISGLRRSATIERPPGARRIRS